MTEVLLNTKTEEPMVAPSSLRERNKEKKRVAIFKATRELLLSETYDRMTMEAIADHAEVGVATIYKYFGTKDELVMQLVRGDMEETLEEVSKLVTAPAADLSDAIMALLALLSNSQLAKGGASLVRHVFNEVWLKKGELMYEFAKSAIFKFRVSIEALLADFQRRGVLNKSLDTGALAHIIYALTDYNYILFARAEIETVEEMTDLTNKQVRMLLDNWST